MAAAKFKASQEFRAKCIEYVECKLTTKGGYHEAYSGFKHRTFPYLIGLETKDKTNLIVASVLKILPLFLGAMVPVVARKVYPQNAVAAAAAPQGPEAVLKAIASIDPTDAALIFTVVFFTLFNKLSEKYFKRSKVSFTTPHTRICETIESLPLDQFAGISSTPAASDALLKSCLAGIKHEISVLLLDDSEKVISDVVYWEFCDKTERRMRVRSRLVMDKPQKTSVEAHLLQAYYVAKTGKVFAEHDFQHRDNPFPSERASSVDNGSVAYKSILFVPIIINEEEVDSAGETIDHDYCIGVLCVASDRPFRFWRWGDQNRDEGTFGKVAYDHIRPYIQLVRRLAMHGAYRVEVNA
jgi:GAF domain-containing protein